MLEVIELLLLFGAAESTHLAAAALVVEEGGARETGVFGLVVVGELDVRHAGVELGSKSLLIF